MPPTVEVGAILMKDWSRMKKLLGLESDPYSGQWTLLKALDVCALDRKIHAVGWNFFFMAAEVKVMFFGSVGAAKIQNALKRILAKVKQQHFTVLAVTGNVNRHFLGGPSATVSAHSRHIPQTCCLASAVPRPRLQWKRRCARA